MQGCKCEEAQFFRMRDASKVLQGSLERFQMAKSGERDGKGCRECRTTGCVLKRDAPQTTVGSKKFGERLVIRKRVPFFLGGSLKHHVSKCDGLEVRPSTKDNIPHVKEPMRWGRG